MHVLIRELAGVDAGEHADMGAVGAGRVGPAWITVVGDSDQSIYAFRGADIRNIQDFEQDFPNAKTIMLEQNYRSTQTILDAANAVIAHNEGRKPKRLWTAAGAGEQITAYAADTAQHRAPREDGILRAVQLAQLAKPLGNPEDGTRRDIADDLSKKSVLLVEKAREIDAPVELVGLGDDGVRHLRVDVPDGRIEGGAEVDAAESVRELRQPLLTRRDDGTGVRAVAVGAGIVAGDIIGKAVDAHRLVEAVRLALRRRKRSEDAVPSGRRNGANAEHRTGEGEAPRTVRKAKLDEDRPALADGLGQVGDHRTGTRFGGSPEDAKVRRASVDGQAVWRCALRMAQEERASVAGEREKLNAAARRHIARHLDGEDPSALLRQPQFAGTGLLREVQLEDGRAASLDPRQGVELPPARSGDGTLRRHPTLRLAADALEGKRLQRLGGGRGRPGEFGSIQFGADELDGGVRAVPDEHLDGLVPGVPRGEAVLDLGGECPVSIRKSDMRRPAGRERGEGADRRQLELGFHHSCASIEMDSRICRALRAVAPSGFSATIAVRFRRARSTSPSCRAIQASR